MLQQNKFIKEVLSKGYGELQNYVSQNEALIKQTESSIEELSGLGEVDGPSLQNLRAAIQSAKAQQTTRGGL